MVTAFIPARGGSKSIPLKNIKPLCGKPLIYWVLASLESASGVDRIVVATDSDVIKKTVMAFGFKKTGIYDRDPENAADTSSTESVMLEYIRKSALSDGDIFVLVQATTPFTRADDFDEALRHFSGGSCDTILSAVRTKRFFWDSKGVPVNYDYTRRPRRQDFEGLYMENGAFYISTVGGIKKHGNRLWGRIGIHEMPEYAGFEIDEPDDWDICERLMRRHGLDTSRDLPEIRLFITDVDGVLTDGGMYYTADGDELKKFNTRDGKGMELLCNAGIRTAIMTSEDTAIVERRGKKLRVDHVFQGVKDKLQCAVDLCAEEGISLENVAFVGDDINDRELLSRVGLAACPSDAVEEIVSIPGIVLLDHAGGKGAVRELAGLILRSKNSRV